MVLDAYSESISSTACRKLEDWVLIFVCVCVRARARVRLYVHMYDCVHVCTERERVHMRILVNASQLRT